MMRYVITLALAIVCSEIILHMVRRPRVGAMAQLAHRSVRTIARPRISDHWKERYLIACSARLMIGSLILTGFLISIAAIVWGSCLIAGQYRIPLTAFLLSGPGLIILTLPACFYLWIRRSLVR